MGHAPHWLPGDHGNAKSVTEWWHNLSKFMEGNREVVFMLDANARVGSQTSPAIGMDGFQEPENQAGAELHAFLLRHNLCLPASFMPEQEHEQYTWTSPGGSHHRIDYVAIPGDWLPGVTSAEVLTEVETLINGLDHRPVAVTVSFDFNFRRQDSMWPAFRPDPDSLNDPQARAHFVQLLQQFPPVNWSVPGDEHYLQVVQMYDAAAREAFLPPMRTILKPYIKEDTFRM